MVPRLDYEFTDSSHSDWKSRLDDSAGSGLLIKEVEPKSFVTSYRFRLLNSSSDHPTHPLTQAWGDVPVSRSIWGVGFRPTAILTRMVFSAVVGLALTAHACMAQAGPANKPVRQTAGRGSAEPDSPSSTSIGPCPRSRWPTTAPRSTSRWSTRRCCPGTSKGSGCWISRSSRSESSRLTSRARDVARSITCTTRWSTARASRGCSSPSSSW